MTIPPAEGEGLAGTYNFKTTYKKNNDVATTTGGLADETLATMPGVPVGS